MGDPLEDLYGPPPADFEEARRRKLASQSGDQGNGLSSSDPLGPPQDHGTQSWSKDGHRDGAPSSPADPAVPSQGTGTGNRSDTWQPDLYKPKLVAVPQANFGARMADGTNTLHNFLGNILGNGRDIQMAQATNARENQKYEQSIEAAKVEAPQHFYRNQFGTGTDRPMYVMGDDGKPHIQRPNRQTGGYDISPEVAAMPTVEAAKARNEGKKTTTDELFADVLAHPENYDQGTVDLANQYGKRKGSFAPNRPFAIMPMNTEGGVVGFNPNTGKAQPTTGVQGVATKVSGQQAAARPREDATENKLRADAAAEETPGPATRALNNYVTSKARSRGKMPDQKGGPAPAPAQGGSSFKSADDVKAAYRAGQLSKGDAAKILQSQFGMQ